MLSYTNIQKGQQGGGNQDDQRTHHGQGILFQSPITIIVSIIITLTLAHLFKKLSIKSLNTAKTAHTTPMMK